MTSKTKSLSGEDNRPIGVFDSGIGGLTSMRELIRLLPHEDIIYFGDTARVPYGSHSTETIISYAKQDLAFLLSRNVKAVLIACGTASATALKTLRSMTDIPLIGVIEAAATTAVHRSKNKRIAVLATSASIRSHAYAEAIHRLDADTAVKEVACPLFVPLIENGYADSNNPVTQQVVENYLKPILPFGADTVILGCTHYPLLKDAIQEQLPDAEIVEAGKEAAIGLTGFLQHNHLCADTRHKGIRRYAVSEITDSFQETCELFLGEQIEGGIELVNLD